VGRGQVPLGPRALAQIQAEEHAAWVERKMAEGTKADWSDDDDMWDAIERRISSG
jgi:hypothetical protein